MYIANVFQSASLPRLPALASPLLQHFAAWFQGNPSRDSQHHTRDSAATLYARAAHYEATQPGFAADLRAAAEAMDRIASNNGR